MKYKVGEVANLLGLTTTAIRFYETEGIIETKKEKNGHRYYELQDLVKLMQCKEARNRGIPLKEITKAFENTEYNARMFIGNNMRNKLMLEEKIEMYKRLVADLDQYIEQLYRMEELEGNFEIVECEPTWFNGSPDGNFLDKSSLNNEVLSQWVDNLPFTKLGALFELDMENPKNSKAKFGLLISEEEALKANLAKSKNVVQMERTICLHTSIICKSFFSKPDYALTNVVDYLNKKKLQVVGPVYGIMLFHDNDEEQTKSYMDLWIPIES